MCKEKARWRKEGEIVFGGISITFSHVRKLVMLLSSKKRRGKKLSEKKGRKVITFFVVLLKKMVPQLKLISFGCLFKVIR
jgi:hypothetical protein